MNEMEDSLSLVVVAGLLMAMVFLWWPLIVYSWHYWFG